jgi:hypothetical protein
MRGSESWKGALMETVKDERTGKTAEVRFDKKKGRFFCIIGEDNIMADTIREVRSWAQARVKLSDAVTWMPVLEVTAPDEDEESRRFGRRRRSETDESSITADMRFSAERYYVGRTEAGRWYFTSWESRDPESQQHLPDDEVIAHARDWNVAMNYESPTSYQNRNRASSGKMPKFKLPYREADSNMHYMAYDEEAWTGLQVIAANVAASRLTLRKLLIAKDAIASLQQIAAGTKPLLLGAGGK